MADSNNADERLDDDSSELTPETNSSSDSATDTGASEADSAADKAAADKPKKVKRNQTVAPVKKSKKKQEATEERTGPVKFVKQVIAELKKVVWPTADETWQSFVVVLFFVLFMMFFVAGLDWAFGWVIMKWLG